MKTFITCAFLALGSLFVQAQNDTTAQKLLDEVSAKTQSYKNISISFSYELNNPSADVKRSTEGILIMEGEKYVLEFLGIKRICDGSTIWDLFIDDEEGTISNVTDQDDASISPKDLFSIYKKGFKYKMGEPTTIDGVSFETVELFPENLDAIEYSKIILSIDAKKKQIVALKEMGNNGTITNYIIKSMKSNQILTPSSFSFDTTLYTDFYMQDMR
jgi:outer membrane lipoprotein-sorting protein